MSDSYLTIATAGESLYTEKRSKFLGFAFGVSTEDEVKDIVLSFKKKYFDARHVCYAYKIGYENVYTRSNDDGEPSGSAGKPILGQIQSLHLTNVLVIVVRYFGGVKLGTGGLAVAYKTAASAALSSASIVEQILTEEFKISAPYPDADVAMRFVREGGGRILGIDYLPTKMVLNVSIRKDAALELKNRLVKILTLEFLDA